MTNMEFFNQLEAARLLRISERTLERKRLDGSGPLFRKFGRRVVYSTNDLKDWADAQTYTSTSDVKPKLRERMDDRGAA